MDKRKKLEFYSEIIEKRYKEIAALEKRMAKAEKIGADKKENKYYKNYQDVCEQLEKQLEHLKDYSGAYKKLSGIDYVPRVEEAANEVFK